MLVKHDSARSKQYYGRAEQRNERLLCPPVGSHPLRAHPVRTSSNAGDREDSGSFHSALETVKEC